MKLCGGERGDVAVEIGYVNLAPVVTRGRIDQVCLSGGGGGEEVLSGPDGCKNTAAGCDNSVHVNEGLDVVIPAPVHGGLTIAGQGGLHEAEAGFVGDGFPAGRILRPLGLGEEALRFVTAGTLVDFPVAGQSFAFGVFRQEHLPLHPIAAAGITSLARHGDALVVLSVEPIGHSNLPEIGLGGGVAG